MTIPVRYDEIRELNWQHKLGSIGEIEVDANDINQAIGIILSTPLGSDPHRPLFGSKVHQYIDWPIPRAAPYVVRDAADAIAKWEPRIEVKSIEVFQFEGTEKATLRVRVTWSIGSFTADLDVLI